MSAIVINGTLVHYEAWGRGSPLILVHGWLGSWRYWMQTMEALATDYRTYALDLWGFGDSSKEARYYNIASYVQLLDEFMEQMGIESAPLVGHAIGGVAALILASRRPERVKRLVTIGLPMRVEAVGSPLRALDGVPASHLARRRPNQAWARKLLSLGKITYAEVANETSKADPAAIAASIQSLAAVDLGRELRRVKVPVLALFGKDDPLILGASTPPLHQVRSIVLENSRHFPMLEEPAQFHRLLRDFLVDAEDLDDLEVKAMWHRRTH